MGFFSKRRRQDRKALRIADRYGLTEDYKTARRKGLSPQAALEGFDLIAPGDTSWRLGE